MKDTIINETTWTGIIDKQLVFIWAITSLIAVLFSNEIVIYGVFIITLLKMVAKKRSAEEIITGALTYSCMLPDNYTVIFISLSVFVFIISKRKIFRSALLILIMSCCSFLVSIAVNEVYFTNILFSLVYLLPTIILFIYFEQMNSAKSKRWIYKCIMELFSIQACATISNFLGKILGVERGIPGDDWSTGTLGNGQGNLLFMIVAIIFLCNFDEIINRKMKKRILFIFLVGIMLLVSHSYALFILFVLACGLGIISQYGLKKVLIPMVLLLIVSFSFMHARKYDLLLFNAFADYESFSAFFPKIKIFKAAFVNIPSIGITKLLFGVGPGMFSSRAAATCTGLYISSYNSFFEPHIGDYMNEYVFNSVYMGFLHSGESFGSILYLPYTSVASIMSEFGLFGVSICLFMMKKLVKGKTKGGILIVIFMITACFVENWIEYAKVMLIFMACLYLTKRAPEKR